MEVIEIGKSKQLYTEFPNHQHGYWEVLLNLKGSGQMYIGSEVWPFEVGDIFVIPPLTLHKKTSEEGFLDISMFIRDFRPVGGMGIQHFKDDAYGSVRKTMEMAYFFSQSETEYDRSAINVTGDLVYQLLAGFYSKQHKRDLRMETILEVMDKNISNPAFDISEAIEATGCCKGYFRKMFKQQYGQSPVKYFNQKRIEKAQSMIQQYGDSRSVKDIALACGFEDALYFSRVFKQYVGIRPSDYQKQCQQKDVQPIIMDTPPEYF